MASLGNLAMKGEGGVGEIAQWLSALAALTEDSSSVPNILIIKFHFGGGGGVGSDTLFCLLQACTMCTKSRHIHVHVNTNKKLF